MFSSLTWYIAVKLQFCLQNNHCHKQSLSSSTSLFPPRRVCACLCAASPTFLLHFGRSGGSERGRSPSGSARLVWWGRWSAPDTGDSLQSAEPTYAVSSPGTHTDIGRDMLRSEPLSNTSLFWGLHCSVFVVAMKTHTSLISPGLVKCNQHILLYAWILSHAQFFITTSKTQTKVVLWCYWSFVLISCGWK